MSREDGAVMNLTQERDQICRLARSDTETAHARASAMPHSLFRVQALAYVARYARSEARALRICDEALASAAKAGDRYVQVWSTSWPLRALIERGLLEDASRVLEGALQQESAVQPPSSRSQALHSLFQAAFTLGPRLRLRILTALIDALSASEGFWRARRNVVDAVLMCKSAGDAFVDRVVPSIPDEAVRKRIERVQRDAQLPTPRSFFRD